MPTHEHTFAATDWPFADPSNLPVLTTRHVVENGLPILLVTHEMGEGAWQLLCGTAQGTTDFRVECLGCLYQRDPSIGELADLPLGWYAWRASPESPWHRGRNDPKPQIP